MPPSYIERFRLAARYGIKNSAVGREVGGIQESGGALIGQTGRVLFGHLFRSLPFSTLPDLNVFLRPGAVVAAGLDSLFNGRRNFSVVGTLSRTFSVPSVSGPSFQVCGYHIDRLSAHPAHLSGYSENHRSLMAASGFKAAFGDCFIDNLLSWRSLPTVLKNNELSLSSRKGGSYCGAAMMSLKNHDPPDHATVYGFYVYNAMRSKCNADLFSFTEWKGLHSTSASSVSVGIAPDVSFHGSSHKDQEENTSASFEQKALADRTLKLISGSCYLPHPDKEETGGEDAHFICAEEQAIGVADGVGGWAEHGIDAGQYARELMSNSVNAIQDEPKGSVDPARVLEKAHSNTKAKGSSTACIIALTNQGLHAVNLGDSGFIVVRDGCTVFRSPAQQHDFNFTFQLESGTGGDLPSSGQVFTIAVAPGDAIIAGTDGLFDNLYNNEVTAIVVHAIRAGLGPEVTAQKIAALARQRAQDRNRQTPFSTAAQDAGFRYYGGKLDDITVVVSYISRSNNDESSLQSSAGSGSCIID